MLARSDRFAGNVSCLAIIFSGPSRDGPSPLGVHACLLLEQAGIFLSHSQRAVVPLRYH
jgi:hypothetical protein